jgi:indolepyruvate decarboxylase
MMLGKTVLDESHPQFIGLYQGARSRPYVRQRVETADCVTKSWVA